VYKGQIQDKIQFLGTLRILEERMREVSQLACCG